MLPRSATAAGSGNAAKVLMWSTGHDIRKTQQ